MDDIRISPDPLAAGYHSEPAGRGSRLAAAIVDNLIVGVPLVIIALIVAPHEDEDVAAVAGVFFILYLLAVFVVQVVLLTTSGQTVGKKALNIKIVRKDTRQNGGFVPNVLLRAFLNGLIGLIPLYGLIDILLIFSDDRRCIHDHLAGTIVVNA